MVEHGSARARGGIQVGDAGISRKNHGSRGARKGVVVALTEGNAHMLPEVLIWRLNGK
jgi:hypothetical protein